MSIRKNLFIDATAWKAFAQDTDFVFTEYNDAMIYGEMIVISNVNIEKEFLECDELPEENLNNGKILENISSWIDIAGFVDNDELFFLK